MSNALRQLNASRRGPWAYQSDSVKISVARESSQPGLGSCNVCQDKKYLGKTIQLFDLFQPERSITVVASGRYECPPNRRVPDIQLNYEDAVQLLGFQSLNQY